MLEFILIEKCPNTNLLKAISEKEAEIKKQILVVPCMKNRKQFFDEK